MIIRYLSCVCRIYGVRAGLRSFLFWSKPNIYSSHKIRTADQGKPRHPKMHSLHTSIVHCRDLPGMWALRKVGHYINNDPLTKISLIFGGGLLAFLLLLEFLTSLKQKKRVPAVTRPPRAMHPVIDMRDEVELLGRAIKALRKQSGLPVLFLIGPPGVGKTHVAHQYAEGFASRRALDIWTFGNPVVLCVDGSSDEQFLLTLREAAILLGVKLDKQQRNNSLTSADGGKKEDPCLGIAEAIGANLSSTKVPWLLVVDNLASDCSVMLDSLQEGLEGMRRGVLLVTAQSFYPGRHGNRTSRELRGVSNTDAVKVIRSLVSHVIDDVDANRMVAELPKSMLAAALAGATVNYYFLALEQHGNSNPGTVSVDKFLELMGEETLQENKMDHLVSLYLEAASSCDPRLRHGLDFIASFGNAPPPIPVLSVDQHLSGPFYALPPPLPAVLLNVPHPSDKLPENGRPDSDAHPMGVGSVMSTMTSYFEQFKSVLKFWKSGVFSKGAVLPAGDGLGTLRQSPLLTFQSHGAGKLETVRASSAAFPHLCTQFATHTVPQLESAYLVQAEDRFNRTAWLRAYRTFSSTGAMAKYFRALPGVSSPGVATEDCFKRSRDRFMAALHHTVGCRPRGDTLTYSEYLHLVSHYHRVTETLSQELKSASTGDMEDVRLKVVLGPLFGRVSRYPLLSTADKLTCDCALASIEASVTTGYSSVLARLEPLLSEQRKAFGSRSLPMAQTLVEMADLRYSMRDLVGAKRCLEEALSVHEHLQSTLGQKDKCFLDLGLTLSSMGVLCSTTGDHQRGKDYLEQALGAYQTVPEDGNITRRQKKLMASTLTDLGHAYLFLGQLTVAKKHAELAVEAARSVYGEGHPEFARALNVKSIACAMAGDRAESRRLRQEAGNALERKEGQQPQPA